MPTTVTLRVSPHPCLAARPPVAQAPVPDLLAGANRVLLRGIETLEQWQARHRQRRELRALSDHLLHDIGRSRSDIEAEAGKPFWRG